MQAGAELELRSPPDCECVGALEKSLGGELFDDAALPWWERPPFSGSTQPAAEGDPAGFRAAGFESTVDGPQTLPPKTFLSALAAVATPGSALQRHDGQEGDDEALEPESARPNWSADGRDTAQEADSLSYEGALRRGAHVSLAGRGAVDSALPQSGASSALSAQGAAADEFAPAKTPETTASESSKRRACVTLRLSGTERAQLKQRAAEAGLTVSAYIRSCTFEAEALRAQVRQAVKELRGELHGEPRVADDLKKPPMPEHRTPDALAGESTRRWWQLHVQGRSHSAQAQPSTDP